MGETHLGGGFEHLCGETGLGANTDSMVVSNLLEKFLFRQGLGVMIDLKTLLLKRLDGLLADIFEEEETEVTRCKWVQCAWPEVVVVGLG